MFLVNIVQVSSTDGPVSSPARVQSAENHSLQERLSPITAIFILVVSSAVLLHDVTHSHIDKNSGEKV